MSAWINSENSTSHLASSYLMKASEIPAVVKDACALIDLVEGGLLAHWFRLGIRTITSDFVIRETQEGTQWPAIRPHIEASNLEVLTLQGAELIAMQKSLGHLRISQADRSALFLAVRENAIVISGDNRVRLDGHAEGIEVHGILWVLGLLVDREIIDGPKAATALSTMLDKGAHLPGNLVTERLKKWNH